jgi:tetratricopeptide (TPR) repeat protein
MADVSRFLSKADEALKKRNYDYAIQMYREALISDPGNAEARRNYRMALLRKYDEQGYPRSLFGGLGAMKTNIMSKDPLKTIEEYEKIIEKDPKSIKYNLRVAENLAVLSHHEAAVAVLEFVFKSSDNGSNDLPTLKLLAREYVSVKRTKDAQSILNKAQRIAPNDKDVKELSKNIAAQGMLDSVGSAKSSYELVKNSGQASQLEKAQKIVVSSDDLDGMITLEEEKLKTNPMDRRAIRDIAKLFEKKKLFDKAYNRLMAFMQVDPSATEIAEEAAQIKNRGFDFTMSQCRLKAQQEPQNAAGWLAKEQQYAAAKKAFGLEEFGRQVEAAPTDMDKRYRFGEALFNTGKFEESFKHLQKAAKSPKHAKPVGLMIGACLVQMGKLDMAESQLLNVQKTLTPEDESLQRRLVYTFADLLERKGDAIGALEKFQSLYLEDAEFMDVEKRIEAVKRKLGQA